jgi:hypothetical protein
VKFTDRIWLVLAAMVPYGCDIAITLYGQSNEYWKGDFSQTIEGNPIAHWILRFGPIPFAIFATTWASIIIFAIITFSQRYSVGLSLMLVICHAIGFGSWLTAIQGWGWLLVVLWLIVMERWWGYCYTMAQQEFEENRK